MPERLAASAVCGQPLLYVMRFHARPELMQISFVAN
jgi:hypothetical protein